MEEAVEALDDAQEDTQSVEEREIAKFAGTDVVNINSPTSTITASVDAVAIGNALVNHLQPRASDLRLKLEQVLRHQAVLDESVTNERNKMENVAALRELERTFVRVEQYRVKLIAMRQTMQFVRERVDRMRVRAVKLNNAKKAELERAQRAKQAEIERDRSLAPLAPAAIRELRSNPVQSAPVGNRNETDKF